MWEIALYYFSGLHHTLFACAKMQKDGARGLHIKDAG
jgi:hypothetical protein